MPKRRKKHDNLFDSIANFPALMAAAEKAIKGKRRKPGAASFHANLEKEVLRLERVLQNGSYRPGRYTVIQVKDPKPRTVSAAPFLGYVLLPGGYRRLPEDNVQRFRNRLRGLRDRWRAGTVEEAEVRQRISSWVAHAENANTWRLRQTLFRDGWFNSPKRNPDRSPVANAFFGAALGTTNPGTSARRTATGTTPVNGTTTTGSASPARPIA